MLGDGFDMPADTGPFDRIIVTAAMEQIPENLIERLEPDGILIAPVGPHHGRADAGPPEPRPPPGSSARSWSTSASCRRCRALRENCRTIRIGCAMPTSYWEG